MVRSYLQARWRASHHVQELDDAVQEVFVACFRPDGVLTRADPDRPGGFRSYLHGVVRNVARRIETGRGRSAPAEFDWEQIPDDDPTLSQVFDRAWARVLMREAGQRMTERARSHGPEALRRVELLRLRFHDRLPIREVARLWKVDPARLHHEYATARREFLEALREVVAFHQPGPPVAVEKACRDLLGLLG